MTALRPAVGRKYIKIFIFCFLSIIFLYALSFTLLYYVFGDDRESSRDGIHYFYFNGEETYIMKTTIASKASRSFPQIMGYVDTLYLPLMTTVNIAKSTDCPKEMARYISSRKPENLTRGIIELHWNGPIFIYKLNSLNFRSLIK